MGKEVFCSSSKSLRVFFAAAKEDGLIPSEVSEYEDAYSVDEEACRKCRLKCCPEHHNHEEWLKQWEKLGKPIPDEVIKRFNKPWF